MSLDETRHIFFIESSELLEEMESGLLRLERSPDDHEAINSVFRAVHTVKGSSGLVGLDGIEGFAHKVESLLDLVRQGEVTVNEGLVELLLECRDHFSTLLTLALSDKEPDGGTRALQENLSRQIEAILNISAEAGERPVQSDTWHISLRFGRDLLRDGLDPISFLNYLSKVGETVSLTTLFDAIPPATEMDPESCYLGVEIDLRSELDRKSIEDVFEFILESCTIRIIPPRSEIRSYIKLIEELPEDNLKLGELLVRGGALTHAELQEALNRQVDKPSASRIGDILVEEKLLDSSVLKAALKKQKESAESKARESRTIRVDTDKLDQLINIVGELVISGASIKQQADRLRDADLIQSVYVMSRMIEEIRERALRVRMVPLWDTFNRFRRVVRDICHEKGKEIELQISGGETEMDKTVIEKIKDPLMHILRNSADHGIEDPEERISVGKPRTGTILLNAFQDTSDIVIEITDDGRGLDRDMLLNKAIELGMVKDTLGITEEEAFRFILEPGFSTAEKVTSISGRGVGMDVVKRNIEELRGTVEIESRRGESTTIRIRLPLTLAIIEGFLVGVGESFYVAPMDSVVECLELTEEDRRGAHGRHHVNLRGSILPYIRLREVFGDNSSKPPEVENVVVVKYAGETTGLVVDRLYGEVQAVIKSLGRMLRDVNGISGATIMGDGTVALILDIRTLVRTAAEQEA